jgi:hypothetical protein
MWCGNEARIKVDPDLLIHIDEMKEKKGVTLDPDLTTKTLRNLYCNSRLPLKSPRKDFGVPLGTALGRCDGVFGSWMNPRHPVQKTTIIPAEWAQLSSFQQWCSATWAILCHGVAFQGDQVPERIFQRRISDQRQGKRGGRDSFVPEITIEGSRDGQRWLLRY